MLNLNEVADLHVFIQAGTGTDPRERPDPVPGADVGIVDDAVGMDVRPVPDTAVADDTVGTYGDIISDLAIPFDDDVYVNEDILADLQLTTQVKAARVGQGNTLPHQRSGLCQLVISLQLGQLGQVVHTFYFHDGGGVDGLDRDPRTDGMSDNVRQQVFLLGVIVSQQPEPLLQQVGPRHHHAGIDLTQQFLPVISVTLLDDSHNLTVIAPHYTPVTGRLINLCAKQAETGIPGRIHQRRQGLCADQRHIAIEHDDAMGGGDGIDDLHDGMAGAQLLRLLHPAGVKPFMGSAHLLGLVPMDDIDFLAGQPGGSGIHMRQQGFPCQLVHYLGSGRAHTLALSGGKDNGAQGHDLIDRLTTAGAFAHPADGL